MYINGVINKRINTYVAWCLAQPADWWVASAWASPSTLQQKKGAAGHKVRLLSYGEEIRGQSERAASSSWNFYSNECVAPRWDATRRGEATRSWNPPVSRRHLVPISVGFPRRSRDSRESSSRDASRCFYKNHGDQSRSLALTRGADLFLLRYLSCAYHVHFFDPFKEMAFITIFNRALEKEINSIFVSILLNIYKIYNIILYNNIIYNNIII